MTPTIKSPMARSTFKYVFIPFESCMFSCPSNRFDQRPVVDGVAGDERDGALARFDESPVEEFGQLPPSDEEPDESDESDSYQATYLSSSFSFRPSCSIG